VFFALFILMVITLIAEIRSSSRWKAYYFLKGPIIFSKKFGIDSINNVPELSKKLENIFSGTYFPSILFRQLDQNVIAFREKLFEFVLVTYTPVMHGTVIVSNTGHEMTIEGRVNWFPVAFSILWLTIFPFGAFGIFFFIGLMSLLYGIQYYRFTKVGEAALTALKSNSSTK
jgi:hypothetical protein